MKQTRKLLPAFTLALLAPVIAEVLSGATRLSYLFVLIPEIMVWGCGALIIRELVRRSKGLWTQIARPITYHVPKYQPPLSQPILGLIMIAVLAAAAYLLRNLGTQKTTGRPVPPAWVAALAAALFATPWYGLMSLLFGVRHDWPIWMPLLAGCLWAGGCWAVIRYWTSSEKWTDLHRVALCFGATGVIMACGYSGSGAWPRADLIAKIVLNIVAVLAFAVLARHVRKSSTHPVP